MTDTRPRTTYTKAIDLAALDTELGGHGLCSSATEVVVAEGSPVTQAQLDAAVAAHVAPAPPPDPDDALRAEIEKATTIAELKAALLGSKPGQVASVAGRAKAVV